MNWNLLWRVMGGSGAARPSPKRRRYCTPRGAELPRTDARAWPASVALSSLIVSSLIVTASSACTSDEHLGLAAPHMVLEPAAGTALVFEMVVLGRSESDPRIVRVLNRGDGPLTIHRAYVDVPEGAEEISESTTASTTAASTDGRISGQDGVDLGVNVLSGAVTDASAFRVSSAPRVIGPGGRGEIWVRFSPTQAGILGAVLRIETNDPEAPKVTFPLFGSAREACAFVVTPSEIKLQLGEIKEVSIATANASECQIVRMTLDRLVFDFVDLESLPVVVSPGVPFSFRVRHVGIPRGDGPPVRPLRILEAEGTEQTIQLEGEKPLSGCLSAYPSRLDFAQIDPGRASTRSVFVRNECDQEAAITSAFVTIGVDFFSVDDASFPMIVPAKTTVSVPVMYRALAETGDRGEMVLNTNDAANRSFDVELFGSAAFPHAEVFPPSLDFGTVIYRPEAAGAGNAPAVSSCASQTRYVQVYSVGSADLVVDGIEVDPSGDGVFEVTGVTVDGVAVDDWRAPVAVPKERGEMRIFLQFFPARDEPVAHEGTLIVHHNGPESPAKIVLLGRAAEDVVATDVFTQAEGPEVDILWVIDDSGSMFDEQARLIENLSQFVGYAATQHASYQMAVTTTDAQSEYAGMFHRCYPHPPIIDSDYADLATREEAFECTFDVGTSGPGSAESGLGAAKRALERVLNPRLQDPTKNPNFGFLRPDAKLAIVTLSDEDDQSSESNVVLRDYFRAIKGAHRRDRVVVHSIAGPVDEPCAAGPDQSAPGYRYKWMTQEMGGQFINICQPDWQPVLRDLGLDVFTPIDEWALSQAADPGTLRVAVDGVPVSFDDRQGYTYQASSNSIVFHGSAVPAPGAQVTAEYQGVCRP